MNRGADRGSAAIEVALFLPGVFLLFGLLIFAGRDQAAKSDISAAAQTGARAIAIARDPAGAVPAAETAAFDILDVGSVRCQEADFTADIRATEVEVTVSCVVDAADLAAVFPLPGDRTISRSAIEVFDVYRENSNEFGLSEGSGGSNSSAEGV